MLIKVWDRQGRAMHLWPKHAVRQIQLAGWSKNRHNQFIDQVNYSYGSRQHCLTGSNQNGIHSSLDIPATVPAVTFNVKNLKMTMEFAGCTNPFWEKFFYYSVLNSSGCLAVAIDAELKGQFSYIQDFFNEYLAFQPKYFFTEQNQMPDNCNLLIHISAATADIKVRADNKVRKAPYLVVGVKQGIEQLQRFSDTVEQNLVMVDAASSK
jgi:hypothetical protein